MTKSLKYGALPPYNWRSISPEDSLMLCRNIRTPERIVRIILGLGLLALVFVGPQTPWGWLGLVPLVTGALGSCPIYRLFGRNSCTR